MYIFKYALIDDENTGWINSKTSENAHIVKQIDKHIEKQIYKLIYKWIIKYKWLNKCMNKRLINDLRVEIMNEGPVVSFGLREIYSFDPMKPLNFIHRQIQLFLLSP